MTNPTITQNIGALLEEAAAARGTSLPALAAAIGLSVGQLDGTGHIFLNDLEAACAHLVVSVSDVIPG